MTRRGPDGPAIPQGDPWWRDPLAATLADLAAGPGGLTAEEAGGRLARDGPNAVAEAPARHPLADLGRRFANPLVLLLLAASGVAAATGEAISAGIIAGIIVLSVTLDFVQEHRAARAADALRASVALRATVVRGGQSLTVPARELVTGDVVLLTAGDLVPADGRIVEANDCFVDQAALTGEAYPVEKHAGDTPDATDLGAATAAAFLGSSVVTGTARLLVCRTGHRTVLGRLGASLQAPEPPSALEQGTRAFGGLILRLAIGMVLFVLLVNAALGRPWLDSFLFAVALAVGLTPELLPAVVSLTLARGALRLGAEQVIVKRLAAIHDLGAMDVLCTDKTGTLTEARIRLERHLDPSGQDSERLLELAYLNSVFESGLRSPLDDAILRHSEVDVSRWRKVDELPFDFERRRVSVIVDDGTRRLLVVKGAFAEVLDTCRLVEAPGGVEPIDDAWRQALQDRFEALGREGFRVLGVGWREVERTQDRAALALEAELVFAGFAAFEDPPKASARDALERLAADGITVKVVTGDNELVTRHCAEQVGLPVTGVLTGQELDALPDAALARRAEETTLFCRLTPAQKERVIRALRGGNRVVGFLGDGINDAPSLRAAHVGISVDSAVAVARAAADLILLRQDLGVLHAGVREGRRTFGNVMKYVLMGTSSNFGNMFSMAGASAFLPFLPMTPAQVLLNNLLYDCSEAPIPTDAVDEEELRRPRRWDMAAVRRFMLVVGPVSSVFDVLTFVLLLTVFRAGEPLFHTGWFVESLCTQVLVIFVIRTRGNPLRSRPSPALAATALAVVAAAVLLPFTPPGRAVGFVPLPPEFFGLLAAMTLVYLGLVELVKRWFYRRVVVSP